MFSVQSEVKDKVATRRVFALIAATWQKVKTPSHFYWKIKINVEKIPINTCRIKYFTSVVSWRGKKITAIIWITAVLLCTCDKCESLCASQGPCTWSVCGRSARGPLGGFFFPQTAGGRKKKSLFKSPTHSSTSDSDEALFSESVTAALCPGAECATQQTQQWTFSSSRTHTGRFRHIMKSGQMTDGF